MKKLLFFSLLAAMSLTTTELSAKKPKLANPTEKTVTFDSQPRGARVVVDGKTIGVTPVTATIPVTSIPTFSGIIDKIMKKTADVNAIEVMFVKEGYETSVESYKPRVQYDRSYYDNIQLTWPDGVFCEMTQSNGSSSSSSSSGSGSSNGAAKSQSAYKNDGSIPAGEATKAVNRSRPGKTALERTVIRWYFESQPQGARIFWRVISSVPDHVKNTNENWLGNTPFEETRSFNIQGLTYENSRDVQIEIKVRRPGYIDQTKRFNVRQAIDQQEISCFFDMIKAED